MKQLETIEFEDSPALETIEFEDVPQPVAASTPQKIEEPGLLDKALLFAGDAVFGGDEGSMVRGMARGGAMLGDFSAGAVYDLPGAALHAAADFSDTAQGESNPLTVGMKKAGDWLISQGKGAHAQWAETRKAADALTPEYRRNKDFLDDPSLLLNPGYLTEGVADAAMSMIPTYLAAMSAPASAATLVGGVVGGSMEGLGSLQQQLEDGVEPTEALLRSGVYGTASAMLNKIGLDKILSKKAGDGLVHMGAKILASGGTEAFTEWLEGPVQTLAEQAGKLPMLADGRTVGESASIGLASKGKKSDPIDLIEAVSRSAREEVAVIPGSFLLGGGMHAASMASEVKDDTAPDGGDKTFVNETVTPSAIIPEVLKPGEEVDLLGNALPVGRQQASLPVGNGAIPMGTVDTGIGVIEVLPDAIEQPAGRELQALPAETGAAAEGVWPGGRMDLAYDWRDRGTKEQRVAEPSPSTQSMGMVPAWPSIQSFEVLPEGGPGDEHRAIVEKAIADGEEVPVSVQEAYGLEQPATVDSQPELETIEFEDVQAATAAPVSENTQPQGKTRADILRERIAKIDAHAASGKKQTFIMRENRDLFARQLAAIEGEATIQPATPVADEPVQEILPPTLPEEQRTMEQAGEVAAPGQRRYDVSGNENNFVTNVQVSEVSSEDHKVGDVWISPNGERKIVSKDADGSFWVSDSSMQEGYQEKMTPELVTKIKRRDAANIESRAKNAKQEQLRAEKELEAKKEYDDVDGFSDSMLPVAAGRVKKTLNEKTRVNGDIVSRKQMIRDLVRDGAETSSFEEPRIKDMTRSQYNRATNEEQAAHARKQKEGGMVTKYMVGDYVVTKTEHDYANYLASKYRDNTLSNKDTVKIEQVDNYDRSTNKASMSKSYEGLDKEPSQPVKSVSVNSELEQEEFASPKAGAVEYKQEEAIKEVDNGTAPEESGRVPAVERQADVVDGQSAGSAAGNVQESEGTDGAPGREGDAGSVGRTPREKGRNARGRSPRDQSVDGGASGRTGADKRESAGTDADRRAQEVPDMGREPSRQNTQNHRVADEDTIVPGGTVARAKANIAAIKLLKELQSENRSATAEEKRILTQFTGWGSLAQEVFKPEFDNAAEYEGRYGRVYPGFSYQRQEAEAYDKWKERYGKALHPSLGGMMTEEEWDAAKKSTLNAHYTDRSVINAMWSMAERMGFTGGRVLEPSAGTGLFFGLMPGGISEKSRLVGIELDFITGGILQKLYPDADIQVTGFENAKRIGDNSFDMVVSNFPFGSFQVYDKARPEYSKQSIHNYFFSRAIDAVKPGGLVMGITSHFTLDAGGTGKIREMWGQKADLVAAVRLPGTAFEKNAGTQVTTDIIILRKKTDTPYPGEQFRHLAEVQTPDGPTQINEYFVQHPEMVLGEHSLQGSMYGGKDEYTLNPSKSESLDAAMKRVAELLPQNIAGRDVAVANDVVPVQAADDGMRDGTIVEKGGKVFMVVDGALESPEWASNAKKASQAKDYLGVKSVALELINAMNTEEGDANVNRLRAKLNEVYDAYVKEHGAINKRGNKHLEDDLEFPTVAALESIGQTPVEKKYQAGPKKGQKYTVMENVYSKADIFSKRTIYPFTEPTSADSLADAVKVSRVYRNGVNVPYIASLLRMDVEDARAELLKTGDVFENPENGLVEPKDIYLSGNVREKLRIAERAAEDNPAYLGNVEALQKVMPERLSIDAIHVRIGSAWVPADTMKSFMEHIGISYPSVARVRIEGEEGSTQWEISGQPGADARNKWGVEGANAMDIISDSLNLKRSEVFDTYKEDGKTTRVKNAQKSLAAQEKQRALQEEFRRWVKDNDAAAKTVEEVYNDTFNGHVARKFDAPDIKYYPGASQTIELRENQKTGVSRALQESTLLAHGVGSGKTFLQITLAMEMRRLGTAKKPWIVVQGSTLPQFAASFKRLYPGARILAPNEEQRKAKNRQRLLAQIASGDWDAVITPHGFFNSISIDPENETRFINERIEEFEEQIRADYGDKALTNKRENNPTVKAIQRKIEKMKVRLQKLTDTKKDANIFFEQLGVDALIIDEAHAYKRGDFYTKMDNVKGLDRDSSQRSMQMLMKSRHVQEKTGGKNVIMATGTPISNTLTEMWTMFRYTRPDLLKAFGVEQFDDFASTFADTTVSLEETSTGDFKDVERFNRFVNGPELLTMWRMGADVAITENLDYIKGLPKLAGGKVQEVAVERSEALTNYIRSLKAERDAWDRLPGKEKRESSHVPLVIYGKAKKSAIDLRLVDAELADTPGSKANAVVNSVFERWKQHKDTKAAQIIFSDIFQSSDKRFNLFHDIRDKLIARGVPAGEIAIIHDFKTDDARGKLFDKVNAGSVRVLMGTTEKLGVGVNVQERLVAAHHIDAPLRPMDFEQRNGRIRRPGNMFPEVEVFAYGTKNTLDSVTFQQLIAKQKFINQMMRGEMGNRVFENPFDEVQSTFEDMMAAFSGNPLAKEKMKLQADIRRLESLHSAYTSRLSSMRYELRYAKIMLDGAQNQLPKDEKAVAFVEKNFPGGKIEGRKELIQSVGEWLERVDGAVVQSIADVKSQDHWRTLNPKKLSQEQTFTLGNGLKAEVTVTPGIQFGWEGNVEERYTMTSYELTGPNGIEDSQPFTGASGMMTRVENFLSRVMDRAKMTEKRISNQQEQIASLEAELKKPFEQANEIELAHTRMAEIEAALASSANADLDASKAPQEEQPGEQDEQPRYFRPKYQRENDGEYRRPVKSALPAYPKAQAQSDAAPLLELLGDGVNVEVVQNIDDPAIPARLRKQMIADNATDVMGVHYLGRNYLLADNIGTKDELVSVLKHELFHDGLRRMRARYVAKYGRDEGVKQVEYFLEQAWRANKAEIEKLRDAYSQDFPDMGKKADRLGLTEEWLAFEAPKNSPRWYDRYAAAIMRWLRSVGKRLDVDLNFSKAEVREFIQRVMSETGASPASDTRPRYQRTGIDMATGVDLDGEQIVRVVESFDKKDLGIGERFLQTAYWLAKKYKGINAVWQVQVERANKRNKATLDSLHEVPGLFGSSDERLSDEHMSALGDFVWKWEDRQIKGVDDNDALQKFIPDTGTDKVNKATGEEIVLLRKNPAYDEAFRQFVEEQDLPDEVKRAAIDLRMSLDNDWLAAYNSMAKTRMYSKDMLAELRNTIGHRPNFLPHNRYGAYFVAVYKKGEDGEETLYRAHYDAWTKGEAKKKAAAAIAELKKRFPDATRFAAGKNTEFPKDVVANMLSTADTMQVLEDAVAKTLDDSDVAQEIKRGIADSVADIMKQRGWGQHAVGRKNVPGHETQDLRRVIHDYKAGLHGWLTKIIAARDMMRVLNGMDTKKKEEYDYVKTFVRDALRNQDEIDTAVNKVKAVIFVKYIAGVISTGVINMLQNFQLGAPTLSMHTWGADAKIAKAYADLAREQARGRGLSEEERQFMKELADDGSLEGQMLRDIAGAVSGSKLAKVMSKAMEVLGKTMSVPESINRATLALAAFRTARRGKLTRRSASRFLIDGQATYEQASKFARAVVDDAHFNYDKMNRHEVFRGPSKVGRLAGATMALRNFQINNLQALAHMLRGGYGAHGSAAAASAILRMMVIGGIKAIPFYASIAALLAWMSDDDEDPAEKIGKNISSDWLRDMMLYGLPAIRFGSYPGFYLGGSLRMGILGDDPRPRANLTERVGDIVMDAIGVPGAMLKETGNAISAMKEGEFYRALEEVAPRFAKLGMNAHRGATNGYYGANGAPLNGPGEAGPRKLGVAEAAGKAVGFTPVSTVRDQDRKDALARRAELLANTKEKFVNRSRRAFAEQNWMALSAQAKGINDWNKEQVAKGRPDLVIKPDVIVNAIKNGFGRKMSQGEMLRLQVFQKNTGQKDLN